MSINQESAFSQMTEQDHAKYKAHLIATDPLLRAMQRLLDAQDEAIAAADRALEAFGVVEVA